MIHICLKDEANKNGGKWMVRLKKGIASRCWENLVSSLLHTAHLVFGLTLHVPYSEKLLWEKNFANW